MMFCKRKNIHPIFISIHIFLFCLSANADVINGLYSSGNITITNNDGDKASLYVQGNLVTASSVTDNTTCNILMRENALMVLTGNFLHNITQNNVFTFPDGTVNTPQFEFRGTSIQYIRPYTSTPPNKETNYIQFPNIKINNELHVSISPQIAMTTEDIDLTKGWLIVDCDSIDLNNTEFAHLLVNGNVDYHEDLWNTAPTPDYRGMIQVNLGLYNSASNKRLIGFGSPFNQIKTDYFIYNTLLTPDHNSIFGNYGEPLKSPYATLEAGKGYMLAIDIFGDNEDNYPLPVEGIFFNQRATRFHYFNRHLFSNDTERSGNQLFGDNPADEAYTTEKLNTEDITITLKKGYNYLANPYTTPLNIASLLTQTSGLNPNWNVNISTQNQATAYTGIANLVWLLNSTSNVESAGNPGNPYRVIYTHNYLPAQSVGGTTDSELIAPLQMFVVYSFEDNLNITIPRNERTTGSAGFLRTSKLQRKDDFVIEISDEKTQTMDRMCFVLRHKAEIETNASYSNTTRLVSTTKDENGVLTSIQQNGIVEQNNSSQIYTRDSKNMAMTTQFFPLETTEFIQLYFTPAFEEQDITLRGLRINTMTEVDGMWLEDRIEKNIIPFAEDTEYKTHSKPTDREDRFVIHLKKPVNINGDNNLIAYYQNESIVVEGFMDESFGSVLYLYDIGGRLINSKIIDRYQMKIDGNIDDGIYVVKAQDTAPQTLKVLVK